MYKSVCVCVWCLITCDSVVVPVMNALHYSALAFWT